MIQIPVFIINLKKRTDRKEHIIREFHCRNEFRPVIVEAVEHSNGAIGLWTTIRQILLDEQNAQLEYVIICEDDHQFTEQYSSELLISSISEAEKINADILCGGVSGFENAIAISDRIVWVEMFSGMQFTVLFRRFFDAILKVDFGEDDATDTKISRLTRNKFFIFPFISIQREFGYSDVTPRNSAGGRVELLFTNSMTKARAIKYICDYYGICNKGEEMEDADARVDSVTIPTYVICDLTKGHSFAHINREFEGKYEFSVSILSIHEEGSGDIALMHSIRQVIGSAVMNGDDIIVLCAGDHEFTEHYSKTFLLKNVQEAYNQGAEILSGGIGQVDVAVPVSPNRFWINMLLSIQFLVLYKSVFQKILECTLDETAPAARLISSVTSNKMTLFPFVSIQEQSGYRKRFVDASGRLELLQNIRMKYCNK